MLIVFYLMCLLRLHAYEFTTFDELQPKEFAIVQFDSRKLSNYWLVSALWNYRYAKQHGHEYIYYQSESCYHMKNSHEQLAAAWCKVKSMVAAFQEFPHIKVFVYMDSDAVINKHFLNISMGNYMKFIQQKVNWNVNEKPVIFNQDGPCWWCDLIQKAGYSTCLNSGTVAWVRDNKDIALQVLTMWWDSVLDSYENNPLKRYYIHITHNT